MLIFVKLGGSLITDKTGEQVFLQARTAQLAGEIAAAVNARPGLELLIGHGSGSFGHVTAHQFGTVRGVFTTEQWRGYAQVSTVAAKLNGLVAAELESAGVPVMRFQPSASAHCRDGVITHITTSTIERALRHGLVPLVYGDVSFDDIRGGTIISTEAIFFYLAQVLQPTQILILGMTDGVYDTDGSVIPKITPHNLAHIETALGGSHGTDVTGGMETKVRDMVSLVQRVPNLEIRIMSGLHEGILERTLCGDAASGTVIVNES